MSGGVLHVVLVALRPRIPLLEGAVADLVKFSGCHGAHGVDPGVHCNPFGVRLLDNDRKRVIAGVFAEDTRHAR